MGKTTPRRIVDFLSETRVVKEAHQRAVNIAGVSRAADTAQDTLLELWESADPEAEKVYSDFFWTLYTDTARRIAKTNAQRERRRGTVYTEDIPEQTSERDPYIDDMLSELPELPRRIAALKLDGYTEDVIRKKTRISTERLQQSLKTIRHTITAQRMIDKGEMDMSIIGRIIAKQAAKLDSADDQITVDRRAGLSALQLDAIEGILESEAVKHGCRIIQAYHHEPITERDGIRTNTAAAYTSFLLVREEHPSFRKAAQYKTLEAVTVQR